MLLSLSILVISASRGNAACTPDGEIAQATSYSLNQEMIAQEELFDGFYAICTGLEDDAPAIIKANAGRWIIENALHGSAGFRTDTTDSYQERDEMYYCTSEK